jgi:hypothetical protein
MTMQTDVWAITPSTSATLLRAAASFTAGAATLLTNQVEQNGCGYKLVFTSSGNDSNKTFTIVGTKVGQLTGQLTTEVVTGGNATTAASTNFYSNVVSITISATSAGTVSIGTTGSLALPRCRIKGCYYVGATSAGSISVNSNSTSGTLLFKVPTPASSTAFANSFYMAGEGIPTGKSSTNDFAIVTLDQVTQVTLICG